MKSNSLGSEWNRKPARQADPPYTLFSFLKHFIIQLSQHFDDDSERPMDYELSLLLKVVPYTKFFNPMKFIIKIVNINIFSK